jgi:hypothetical protein
VLTNCHNLVVFMSFLFLLTFLVVKETYLPQSNWLEVPPSMEEKWLGVEG